MEADFRVTKGTSVLLCGGEGSGKSTFLRALASVLFKCVRSEACDGVPGRAEVSDRNLAFHFGRGGCPCQSHSGKRCCSQKIQTPSPMQKSPPS
mmetsp:Transcript_49809/g.117133  ORF Transcript_49809/g.117133 Transcript_49809/m.117133 type:complete len:94 (+) Transcript_49809:1565-1846(+)